MIKFLPKTFCLLLIVFFFEHVYSATYYSRATGNWGNAATWSTVACNGAAATTIPTASDNVVICAGHTITMNGNPGACLSLTINGTASWGGARTTNVGTGGVIMDGGTITGTATGTLNVAGNFTVQGGTSGIGRIILAVSGTTYINSICNITNATGSKTFTNLVVSGTLNNNLVNQAITINGNLTNNGTYNVGTGTVTFGGASNNTITGTSTTAFTSLNINKGTSQSNILEVLSNITLTSSTTVGLVLTNGTLKLSNTSINITPFPKDVDAAPFLIPSTAALWCNGATINSNPALTSSVVGNALSGNWSVAGLLRISAGTVTLGTVADQRFRAVNAGTTQLIIEGGTFNIAGRLSRANATDYIAFTMSGGTLNVPTVGSTSTTLSPIQMDQTGSSFTMTGGTIVIEREGGSGAEDLGFLANAGTVGISGGIIQFGNASTPAGQTMRMNSTFSIANLVVGGTNSPVCLLAANLTVLSGITINSGGTLNANNLNITHGGSWTNNGTWIPGTGTITFNGTGTQTITKTGGETFYNVTVNKPSGTVTLPNNLQVNTTLTMTSGNIDCGSSTLTLGTSTASPGTLTYSAGTIIGTFKRWKDSSPGSLLFPIGTSSYYRSALVTFTSVIGGTLTANFVSSDPGSNGLPYLDNDGITTVQNQYTEGYWNLTAADGLSSANYNIECTGNGFTSYSMGASTRLMYRATSGNPWIVNGTHTAASGNTAKRNAVSGLSAQFAFGKPACSVFLTTSITTTTPNPICASQLNVDYSVNASNPANTYAWSLPLGGGTIDAPATGTSITVDWGSTGGNYSVQVIETNDCGDANTPVTLAVTVHPIATSAISGATAVSVNELDVPYSVTLNPGYSYSWSLPLGGGTIDAPASGTDVNSITVDWGATAGTYSVRVDVTPLCGSPDFQTLSVTSYGIFYSRASSTWATAGTWSSTGCGGTSNGLIPGANNEVVICAGHTITMNGNPGACRELTIDGTATWTQGRTTNVGSGGITINSTGNITGTAAGVLTSTGGLTLNSNANISSTTVTIRLQTSAQNIATSGTPGALNILDITTTATNNGTLTIANGGTLSGAGTLVQGTNSTLNMNGSTFSLATLNASASGNTVNYGANANQTIKATTYNNLTLSGTGTITKTLGGTTTVNGNLNISAAGVTLDASTSNYPLTVGGNWTNSGTFNPRFATVTLNGGSTQTITRTGGETFNNLIFSGAGSKVLANDITINFDFTNSSTFDVASNNINIKGNFDNSGSVSSTNDVTFSNNTTVSGPSTTTFNNVIITGTLTGHLSNFNVSGNWTNNGTFTHNGGKVTLSGNTNISGTNTTTFGSVEITGTLTAPSGNMNIAKNFNNSGTFNHNNGTLTFNGSSAQTIQGTNTFYNLTINNSSGGVAVTSGTQNLINTLTLTNGNFNTNDALILVSNASGTARIAEITGGSITGKITMQRHIPNATTSWRQLGTATSGQTLNDWKDDFIMSGFPGSHYPNNSFVSVKTYNETVPGNLNYGFTSPSSISDPITVGKGYMCYVGNQGANIDIDVTNNPNTGNITLPITYTNTGSPADDGWNLVANPYPSNIDWDLIYPTTSNISATIAVWNPATQNYGQYTFGGPNPGPNGGVPIINSTQAFWVQATGASPNITLTESVKTATTQAFFKQSGEPDVLKLIIESSNNKTDETFLIFKDSASANYNGSEDALKLFSAYDVPHIVSVIDDSFKLALNTLPELMNDVIIPIHAGGKATQSIGGGNYICNNTFTISAAQIDAISESICLILEDTKTGTFTNLRDTSYSFTVSDTSNAPAPRFVPPLDSAPRFRIHVGAGIEKSSVNESCTGSSDGIAIAKGKGSGPFNYTWKDENNSVVKFTSGINTADSLKNVSAGTYTVEISGNSGFCSVLKDTIIINSIPSAINIVSDVTRASCFGASDGAITLFVSGNNSPFTYLWSNLSGFQNLTGLSAGNYSVTVTDAANCYSTQTFNISQPDEVTAAFSVSDTIYLSDGGYAFFENTSTGSDYFIWNFGDGSLPDSSVSPTHQYTDTGSYTISLTAISENCGENTYSGQVIVMLSDNNTSIIEQRTFAPDLRVANLSTGTSFFIDFKEFTSAELRLTNSLGQEVFTKKVRGVETQFSVNFPSGVYFLSVIMQEGSFRYKVEVLGGR